MADKASYRYAVIGLGVAEALFLIAVGVIVAVGHTVPAELWTIGTALGGGLLGLLVPAPKAGGKAKAAASAAVAHAAAAKAAHDEATHVAGPAQADAQTAADEVLNGAGASKAISQSKSNPTAAAGMLASAHAATAEGFTAMARKASDAKRPGLQAKARVYQAAADAAQAPETQAAALAAAKIAPSGPTTFGAVAVKVFIPVIVLAVSLALGTLLLTGVWIHPSAAYRPDAIKEGNALLALATATGGALVGIFAPSPGEAKTPAPS